MKLRDWLKQIGRGQTLLTPPMSNTDIVSLVRYLEDHELDCEQVFEVLDRYAEIEVRHEDAARLMPFVREHLIMCGGCYEEYEALMDVLVRAQDSH